MDKKLPEGWLRLICSWFQKRTQLNYISILTFLLSFQVQGQVSGYGFEEIFNTSTTTPVTYASITGTDLFGPTMDQEVSTAIPLGFTFVFNGNSYTTTFISANGFITFGAAVPLGTNYTPISVNPASNFEGVISGGGKNLVYAGFGSSPIFSSATYPSSVSYETTGTPGSRIFTVQYKNMAIKNGSLTTMPYSYLLNFQIKLYEGTNVVEIIHDQFITAGSLPTAVGSPQVGLRGATIADFNSRYVPAGATFPKDPYSQTMPTTASSSVLSFTPTIYPSGAFLFRWSSGCPAITDLAYSALTTVGGNFTWDVGANFEYEVRSSGAPGSGSAGLVTSGTRNVRNVNITGLTGGATYTIYVRNVCNAANQSTWTGLTFTTLCSPVTVPYYLFYDQMEDAYTVPNLPACTRQVNIGANPWITTATAEGGFYDPHLKYTFMNSQAPNAWFFSKGVTLEASKIYRISYTYGGASTNSSLVNKLKVMLGSGPFASLMTIDVEDHNNVRSSPNAYEKILRVPSNGVYYLGFHLYSDMNMGDFYLAEIGIEESNCGMPTGVNVPAALITSSTAQVFWNAPTPAPAGYAYYVSPMLPVVSGSFNATQMIAGYTYQINTLGTTNYTAHGSGDNNLGTVFVATNPGTGTGTVSLVAQPSVSTVNGRIYRILSLGNSNFTTIGAATNQIGTVFTATGAGTGTGTVIEVQIPIPSNLTSPTGMVGSGVLSAVMTNLSPSTTYYVWVRSNCGGTTFGEWSSMVSFTTAVPPVQYCIPTQTGSPDPNGIVNVSVGTINNSTGLEPGGYGNYANLETNVYRSATYPVAITLATGYTYDLSVWVDWNNNGVFESGERVGTAATSSAVPVTATISFTVPAAQPYGRIRMRVGGQDFGPVTDPCRVGTWQAFEDYTLNVTVTPPPLTLSATSAAVCAGTSAGPIMLTAGAANYQTFSWSPSAGVTGNVATGFTFTNTQSTVYTLTAQQTSGNFSVNTVKFNYTAQETPAAVTVGTPDGLERCSTGAPLVINAGGGMITSSVAFLENFENGLGRFTQTANVVGGSTPGAANWTIRPNGYTSGSTYMPFGIFSNDLSNFAITNPDGVCSLCSASVTTTLTSDTIDLTNYQTASLSFYHYFRYLSGDHAYVEVREMPSGAWTILADYTNTRGTNTNFISENYSLSALNFAGKQIQIRFRFVGSWSYYWALDNVKITGRVEPLLQWTPTTGLFTDAAGTVPYTGGGALTLYAAPSVSTTYTVSSTVGSCSSERMVAITVNPIVAGTVNGAQSACSINTMTDLMLVGHQGNVLRWESANDMAFTSGMASISNTTTTLTPAEFGAITGVKYFRAVIGNTGCTTVYSNVVIVSIASTIWNGTAWSNGAPDNTKNVIFNGSYTSSGDVQACSVRVNPGAIVVFQSGHTLWVENNIVVDNSGIPNRLEFENNASLLQNSTMANVGPIYYKRNSTPMRRYAYTYWSTPVAPQRLVDFSPNTRADKFFDFNAVAYAWRTLPGTTVMEEGRGYIMRAPDVPPFTTNMFSVYNGEFFGIPNNGDYQQTIVYNGANNLNLLGNPYPSAISADAFLLANAGAGGSLAGTLYFWTHNSEMVGGQFSNADYALYNFTGSTGVGTAATSNPCVNCNASVPNGYIAAGQGFFVNAKANGTAHFTNAMRVNGNNTMFFRNMPPASSPVVEKNRLWLNLTSAEGAYKQVLLGYIEGASNDYDLLFDGEVLEADNSVSFYSLLNGKHLGIQGRALPFSEQDELPLGIRVTTAGSYQIQLHDKDGLFDNGQAVYLEDKELQILHPLHNTAYSFESASGTFEQRFVLRFMSELLGVGDVVSLSDDIIAYKKTGNIVIEHRSKQLLSQVKIYDISGRLLAVKSEIQADSVEFEQLQSSEQILLIDVIDISGVKTVKKIVF